MRVQRGPGVSGEGLSGAETQVVKQWRSWTGQYQLTGLALVNVNVPDDRGRARQVDAVLFFPHGLAVVEIKGFTEPQSGTLRVPLNGPLTVDGEPAALHTLSTRSPLEQLRGALFGTKNALQAAEIDPGFVAGWLVLVPQPKTTITIDDANTSLGIEVVLGRNKSLRHMVHQLRRRTSSPMWSADRVLQACDALELGALAPTREELLADGFPDTLPAANRPTSVAAVPAEPKQTRTVKPASSPVPRPRPRKTTPAPRPTPRPAPKPAVPAPQYRTPAGPRPPAQRPSRPARPAAPMLASARRVWPTLVVLAVIAILATVACVVIYQAFHSH